MNKNSLTSTFNPRSTDLLLRQRDLASSSCPTQPPIWLRVDVSSPHAVDGDHLTMSEGTCTVSNTGEVPELAGRQRAVVALNVVFVKRGPTSNSFRYPSLLPLTHASTSLRSGADTPLWRHGRTQVWRRLDGRGCVPATLSLRPRPLGLRGPVRGLNSVEWRKGRTGEGRRKGCGGEPSLLVRSSSLRPTLD